MTMTMSTTSHCSGAAASQGPGVDTQQISPQLLKLMMKLVESIIMDLMSKLQPEDAGGEPPAGEDCGQPAASGPQAPAPQAPAPQAPAPQAPAPQAPSAPVPAAPAPADPSAIPNWNGPKPSGTEAPPAGKSAHDIVVANPTLANLDPKAQEMLKKQFPAYQSDPNQAYQASRAVDYIKSSSTSKGELRSDSVTKDGKIEGFTKDHEARRGSEAGLFKDFCEKGYPALKDDHRLDKTTDDHVRTDGTNRNNGVVFAERAGKALVFIPGLSAVLRGAAGADKDHAVGVKQVAKGGAGGVVKVWKADVKGAVDAVSTGQVSPTAIVGNMYAANVEDATAGDGDPPTA